MPDVCPHINMKIQNQTFIFAGYMEVVTKFVDSNRCLDKGKQNLVRALVSN